ncbi:hypothetical protein HI914_03686 [Erysiphe necator]|nr:hypothetical protein HI914_03686 [Erysiphe necator]
MIYPIPLSLMKVVSEMLFLFPDSKHQAGPSSISLHKKMNYFVQQYRRHDQPWDVNSENSD